LSDSSALADAREEHNHPVGHAPQEGEDDGADEGRIGREQEEFTPVPYQL